jgi:hypothetical protein
MINRLVSTVYWLLLFAWLAALVSGGVTAMSAFSTLPKLGVSMPSAAMVIPGADEVSGRFVAGFVAQPAFAFAERLSLIVMPCLVVVLVVQSRVVGWPGPSWPNRLRLALLVIPIVLMTLHLVILAPRMATTLDAYRSAVFDGNAEAAATSKAAFDGDHRKSDAIFRTNVYLLVAAVAVSAWTLTPSRGSRQRGDIHAPRFVTR